MQLCHNIFRCLPRKHERFPVNNNRLADNAGIGQDYKDSASIPFAGLLQKMRHHRRRLAGANRTSAHGKAAMSLRRSAGQIQLSAQAATFVRLAEFRHIVVERSEPVPAGAAPAWLFQSARMPRPCRRGRHPQDRKAPYGGTPPGPRHTPALLCLASGEKALHAAEAMQAAQHPSLRAPRHSHFGIWSILLLQIPSTDRGNPGDGSIPALRHSRSPSSAGRALPASVWSSGRCLRLLLCSHRTLWFRSSSFPRSWSRALSRTMVDRIPFAFTE